MLTYKCDLTKELGRENSRKKLNHLAAFLSWFSRPENPTMRVRADKCKFIVYEIVDNILLHDKENYNEISVEVNIDDNDPHFPTTVVIVHDGKPFNPFRLGSQCGKIVKAAKVLFDPAMIAMLADQDGKKISLGFSFSMSPYVARRPYDLQANLNNISFEITITGELIRGWSLETDEELLRIKAEAIKQAKTNLIIVNLENLDFWDTSGASQILDLAVEINSIYKERAIIVGPLALKDFVGTSYDDEFASKKIIWTNENPAKG